MLDHVIARIQLDGVGAALGLRVLVIEVDGAVRALHLVEVARADAKRESAANLRAVGDAHQIAGVGLLARNAAVEHSLT